MIPTHCLYLYLRALCQQELGLLLQFGGPLVIQFVILWQRWNEIRNKDEKNSNQAQKVILAIPLGKTGSGKKEAFKRKWAESLCYFWFAQSGTGWKTAAGLLEYASKVKLDHGTADTKTLPMAQSACLASFPSAWLSCWHIYTLVDRGWNALNKYFRMHRMLIGMGRFYVLHKQQTCSFSPKKPTMCEIAHYKKDP